MQSLSKILLPVDFSERSVGAGHYAKLLAAQFGSEVTLLHVVALSQTGLEPLEAGGTMLAEVNRSQSEMAGRELESFLAAELSGLNVRRVVQAGDPAAVIVEFARNQTANLIIMPTHGYGPFRRYILGSNTAKVLHSADCPVWTGVHLEAATAASSTPFRRILCAVDLGAQSSRTLCWAAQLALEFGAGLALLHATAAVPQSDGSEDTWRTGIRKATESEIARLQEFVHTEADVVIEAGEPAKVICATAERLEADLLVIGRGSAAGVFGRLRTNAHAIIRMSPCPVVSV